MVDVDTGAPPGGTGSTARSVAASKGSPGAASSQAGTGRGPRRLVTGLAVLLAVLLVAGAVLLVRDRAAQAEPGQRLAAVAQARAVATEIVGLGGENAAEKLQILIRATTGPFRDQLTRRAGDFATAMQAARVTSSGKVAAAGLEEFEPDAATALVVLTGTLANADMPQGGPVSYRLSVQLRQVGGQWLVSGVEVLP
jgi:Mce-associated membrane protein